MTKRVKSLLAVVALLATFVPAAVAQNPAPELTLKDLAGADQSLASLKGKVVLVNFWATWCAPCRKEMPSLVKLQEDYGAKGLQIVAITVDTESYHDKVIAYAKDSKLNFPVWFGSTANMDPFGFGFSLPSTAILDKDGHIVDRVEGMLDDAAIRTKLDGILKS